MLTTVLPIVIAIVFLLFSALKVLNEYERAVVLTLGRYTGTKGPGLVIIIPGLQKMLRVDMRTSRFSIRPARLTLISSCTKPVLFPFSRSKSAPNLALRSDI